MDFFCPDLSSFVLFEAFQFGEFCRSLLFCPSTLSLGLLRQPSSKKWGPPPAFGKPPQFTFSQHSHCENQEFWEFMLKQRKSTTRPSTGQKSIPDPNIRPKLGENVTKTWILALFGPWDGPNTVSESTPTVPEGPKHGVTTPENPRKISVSFLFSLLFVCQSELTEFFAQWVLFSGTVLWKQHSARSLMVVTFKMIETLGSVGGRRVLN